MRRLFLVIVAFSLAVVGYTKISARVLPGTPPEMASVEQQADRIVVDKSERLLTLMRGDETLASYPISLGADGDGGHKAMEGDEKTPEGSYVIDWRNENSVAFLSLHISYPNEADKAAAVAGGFAPGGDIMIHGLPNGWGFVGRLHLAFDWTNGCIAVDNAAMADIWARVPNGTPIEISA